MKTIRTLLCLAVLIAFTQCSAWAGPVPFDGTIFGHDVKSSGLGAFEYEHALDLGGRTPLSAKLTVGLIDVDSPPDRPVETIALTFDGVSLPANMLAGVSALGSPSSVEVVDIPVPVELLADGALHVSVVARRPGYGNLGNAVEADFSRLVVELAPLPLEPDPIGPVDPFPIPGPIIDPQPQPIPLPPMLVPAGILLLGIAVRRRTVSLK